MQDEPGVRIGSADVAPSASRIAESDSNCCRPAIGVHKPISKKAAVPTAIAPNAQELPSPGTRRKNPRTRDAEMANLDHQPNPATTTSRKP